MMLLALVAAVVGMLLLISPGFRFFSLVALVLLAIFLVAKP